MHMTSFVDTMKHFMKQFYQVTLQLAVLFCILILGIISLFNFSNIGRRDVVMIIHIGFNLHFPFFCISLLINEVEKIFI